MNIIKPPHLKKGDTIGILAPCYAISMERLEPSIRSIEKEGYHVKLSNHIFSTDDSYAGTIAQRTEDFNTLVSDDTVQMLLFGGGDVCNELLPYIDYNAVRRHPKILCSYSDSTTILNAVTNMTGLVTFYGFSPRSFAGLSAYNSQAFYDRIVNDIAGFQKSGPWRVIRGGSCSGTLTGGYLVNYAAMQGLPWFSLSKDQKHLLFIEDYEMFSSPSMVSKWFSTLEHRGVFDTVTGLLFGHYSKNDVSEIDRILQRIGDTYQIPIVRCEDFGHGENNAVLPIGIHAELNADTQTLTFTERGTID